jgi:hypothetical protein
MSKNASSISAGFAAANPPGKNQNAAEIAGDGKTITGNPHPESSGAKL